MHKPSGLVTLTAPLTLAGALLALWWLTTRSGSVPSFLLPTPQAVASRAVEELSTNTGFWSYLYQSLLEAIAGCLLGALVALPLAIVIQHSRWVAAAVQPFLGATQAIPAVAIAPLLLLWMPTGTFAVITLCSLMVFFPILVTTTVGLRHLDTEILEAAKLDGASGWELIWRIELPLALPSIMGGLRNGFTLSITGAVVGEMVMGGRGLGTLITLQAHNVDTAGMFVTLGVLCFVAAVIYLGIYQIERHSKTINAR